MFMALRLGIESSDDNSLISPLGCAWAHLPRGSARLQAPHYKQGDNAMNLPQIDLDTLPGLDVATGLFGSVSHFSPQVSDDRIIILMVWLYEVMPPSNLV